jgi:glycosyltransferase involved in cell wall biosynthesis/SAM-dependent methyltransferase
VNEGQFGDMLCIRNDLFIGYAIAHRQSSIFRSVEIIIDGVVASRDLSNRTIAHLPEAPPHSFGHCFALYIPRQFRQDGVHQYRILDTVTGKQLVEGSFTCILNRISSFEVKFPTRHDSNSQPAAINLRSLLSYEPAGGELAETESQCLVSSNCGRLTFFTICSKNFTAYAITLYESIKTNHPDAEFFLFLCDHAGENYNIESLPFPVVLVEQLGIENIEEMASRYNITEFNTAIKPWAFLYVFNQMRRSVCVYLDPDILLISPLNEVIEHFNTGSDCIMTPHILAPAENVEVSDHKMLLFGIYNLGFLALRNTSNVVAILCWWSRRLKMDCVIDIPNGMFVDQKWADLLPAFIQRTAILHHPGYNVAYWNLSQRTVNRLGGTVWTVNGSPLRFVHFSGNKLEDESVFSRHSATITINNIGDLAILLDDYRNRVFGNGHSQFSKLAYSFSWNGEKGVNLHTPMPAADTSLREAVSDAISHEVKPFTPVGEYLLQGSVNSIRTKILFIDWSTPRPDKDAGSITAYYLLKIYIDLGYDVTFIPSDLQHLGDYTRSLQGLGVTCLHDSDIGSVRTHLERDNPGYEFIFLSRAPIAGLYIDDIRTFSPVSKIILNTSDLHYLRDIREAELSGDPAKLEAAYSAKAWELGIIKACDVTIVMSHVEAEILATELPESNIKLIPLMYVEPSDYVTPFEDRKDLFFVGGFPHRPNVDAVVYFCKEIFPIIRSSLPEVNFHIVGNEPPDEVMKLGLLPGVVVHGFVKDLEPLLQSCRVSIVPLRYGAGIKGKIGTSLASGMPVVATPIAVEGMNLIAGHEVLVAASPEEFASNVVSIYQSGEIWRTISEGGRRRMYKEYSVTAGQRRLIKFMQELAPKLPQIELYSIKSQDEYLRFREILDIDIHERVITEVGLVKHGVENFYLNGVCVICGGDTFNTSFMYAYQKSEDGMLLPNWREHLNCVSCGFVNRIRAAMHIFYHHIKPTINSSIYITEQTTSLYAWLKERHPNLKGSEFLGSSYPGGTVIDGLRNEDLTKLTFDSSSFDYILSFDVLEHVADDLAAFSQVYRCLKPGGTFLFAAPFLKDRTEKLIRAKMLPDGTVEHLMEPEYHGNPVDMENGALCFRYFAWDLINDLKHVGFKVAEVLHYWSRDCCYLGTEQFIFRAIK